MLRWLPAVCLCALLPAGAEQSSRQPPKGPPPKVKVQEPPEEDETLAPPKQYAFNPLQANKELQVGNFYFKAGKYKAAAGRFREATKWNPGFAEAWLRLGETEEKRHNRPAAREAYARYLQLSPDAKDAHGIRKKIAKLH
jgi:tetratricopeptide (TPR) repeat protein